MTCNNKTIKMTFKRISSLLLIMKKQVYKKM